MATRITINQGELQQFLTGPQSAAVRLVREGQRVTLNAAKNRAPVDTGDLRRKQYASNIAVRGASVTGEVEAVVDYATAVHEGSRPHVIRPRRAKFLTWVGPQGRVFARSVRHPGAKARPWLLEAAKAEAGRLGFVVAGGD